jgi:phage terminase Nu1 subunit (DNA packaging protein)
MAQVNRSDLAELLGCSLPTITSKVQRGMPYLQRGQRGKEWMFDTADVISWEKDQAIINTIGDVKGVSEDEMKRRKLAAETTILEIDAAKKRGEVAPLHEMEMAWRDAVLEFKARIRLLPSRVAGQLVGLENETEIKTVLLDEVDQSLTVLSELDADDID